MTVQADRRPPTADSLSELVIDLRQEVTLLAKQEIELAKAEYKQKLRNGIRGIALSVVSLVWISLMLVTLNVAAVAGLGTIWPTWLAALAVAGANLLLALLALLSAKKRFKRIASPLPTQTINRIKEDLRWLRRPTR
jgi:Flp pilus assembly protein TadB